MHIERVSQMARAFPWVLSLSSSFRELTLGSLSEFKSFEDWNAYPEIANAARELYGDINKLELYPGLHAEGHAQDGFGQEYAPLRVNTVRNGLLFDAIALVCPLHFFCRHGF